MGPPSVLGLTYLEVRDVIDELAADCCVVLSDGQTVTDAVRVRYGAKVTM